VLNERHHRLQRSLIHLEPVHRIAAFVERPEYEILHRLLGATDGGKAHQLCA
jgi:hypothetical protein